MQAMTMPQTLVTNPLTMTTTAQERMTQEFQVRCVQRSTGCSGVATWAVRSAHGLHCPQDGLVCDACKEYLEASWSDAIRRGIRCANCHVAVEGELSDHLRFLPL